MHLRGIFCLDKERADRMNRYCLEAKKVQGLLLQVKGHSKVLSSAGIGGEYPATSTRAVEESQVQRNFTQQPKNNHTLPFLCRIPALHLAFPPGLLSACELTLKYLKHCKVFICSAEQP